MPTPERVPQASSTSVLPEASTGPRDPRDGPSALHRSLWSLLLKRLLFLRENFITLLSKYNIKVLNHMAENVDK